MPELIHEALFFFLLLFLIVTMLFYYFFCHFALVQDDESIQPEMRDSEEYRELKRLKQMKRDKLRQQVSLYRTGNAQQASLKPR